MTKKKILITGASGFIGSNFVNRYKDEFDFCCLVRSANNDLPGLKVSVQDIKNGILQDFKPDYLIHLAAKAAFTHSINDIEEFVHSNITFPSLVLESFVKAAGKKILNIGSYWQHVDNNIFKPNSFYAATKQSFENIIDHYVYNQQCEAVTVKLFDTYGPKDPRPKVLQLVYNAAKNESPLNLTSGSQLIYLTHVDDVVSGLRSALHEIGPGHDKFFLRPEKPKTLKSIIELFLQVNSLKADLNWGAIPHSGRDFFSELNVLQDLPNWKTKVSLEIGLKDLF